MSMANNKLDLGLVACLVVVVAVQVARVALSAPTKGVQDRLGPLRGLTFINASSYEDRCKVYRKFALKHFDREPYTGLDEYGAMTLLIKSTNFFIQSNRYNMINEPDLIELYEDIRRCD